VLLQILKLINVRFILLRLNVLYVKKGIFFRLMVRNVIYQLVIK